MAKKLTKIDQQRINFLNNIDFSDWKINNQVNIHDWYKWDYRQVFTRYHDVMFDYYKRKSDEEFVKKWWFAMVHKNIQKDVNFHEYPVTNQKADFTIDWDSAAHKIINEAKNKMYWLFYDLEELRKKM
jgi:hypothetical protein